MRLVPSFLVLPFAVATAIAQRASVVALKAPVTAPEEFTRVVSVRELADGRLLASDRRDKRIVLLSFDGRPAVQVGRVGAGPGEYRAAGALIAMPHDSTALIDPGNGRWLVFAGDKIAGTVPTERTFDGIPVGISATHVLRTGLPENGLAAADSLPLLRIDRRSNKTDTIAFVAPQTVRQAAPKKVGDRMSIVRISVSPWSAGDQALLFDDGWVATARVSPYSVDWISPAGKLSRGKPLRASDPPFTDVEKRAFMERLAGGNGKAPEPISSRTDWPDVITAFTSATSLLGAPAPALFAAPGGQLIVRRQSSTSEPGQRYDVIDRSSRVVAQFEVGLDEMLVGTGKSHLYVVATDSDGVQRVRRYDWPFRDSR